MGGEGKGGERRGKGGGNEGVLLLREGKRKGGEGREREERGGEGADGRPPPPFLKS